MKYLTVLFVVAAILPGCAHEATYADNEYGLASMDAFDRQIVHKDYAYADKTVDGMDGLHAEPTMEMYHNSFGDGFTQESINTSSPGDN